MPSDQGGQGNGCVHVGTRGGECGLDGPSSLCSGATAQRPHGERVAVAALTSGNSVQADYLNLSLNLNLQADYSNVGHVILVLVRLKKYVHAHGCIACSQAQGLCCDSGGWAVPPSVLCGSQVYRVVHLGLHAVQGGRMW
eukprot:CAMPEP_0202920770 /NCGR_PEP_ID=MMETSP1392-20130828/77032_1 /ASSEMBLY_ACC=CAM_ASM_000868 /TAXON_ID=225041 /ORGANISM="Chlamydomonas chlamydogama, Strain SAG 11-48b" /LENGTH=139 /DNA_ID=CAMNT_0049614283 /DNA_START=412 /DNA_END=828 /DNA_ORIENTATION=+